MTGQVVVEPVVVCNSSDCILFGVPKHKSAKATADRTQPDRSSGSPTARKDNKEDANSSGGSDSSKLDEPARFCPDKPGRQHSSSHRTLSGAETAVKRFDDAGLSSDSSQGNSPKTSSESGLGGKRSQSSSDGRLADDPPEREVSSNGSSTSPAKEVTSPAPVPIQGQFEMLLRNPDADGDTRSSDMERTSDLSHTLSATRVAHNDFNSSTCNASTHSSQLESSVTSTWTAAEDSSPGKKSGLHTAPENSEEDRSASSAHSNELSSAASGSSSPALPSASRRITWGKAKSYPGSETVSELEDERSSVDVPLEFRTMRKKQAAMARSPARPRRQMPPPLPPTQRHLRDPRGRAKGMRRLNSKSRLDRDRDRD